MPQIECGNHHDRHHDPTAAHHKGHKQSKVMDSRNLNGTYKGIINLHYGVEARKLNIIRSIIWITSKDYYFCVHVTKFII